MLAIARSIRAGRAGIRSDTSRTCRQRGAGRHHELSSTEIAGEGLGALAESAGARHVATSCGTGAASTSRGALDDVFLVGLLMESAFAARAAHERNAIEVVRHRLVELLDPRLGLR